MKVRLVTPEYRGVSGYVGGVGVQYATLAPALVRAGIDLQVLTYGDGPDQTLERDGVRIHAVGRPRNDDQRFWEELVFNGVADRALRKMQDVDLIYAPEWRGTVARLTFRRKRPAVVTNLTTSLTQILALGSEPSRPTLRPRVRRPVQQRLERAQAERSDGLIAASRAIANWSRSIWKLDGLPSATIPNQIDLEGVLRLAGGPLPKGFPTEGPVVVFSGRLQVLKGVVVLVDAMRRVWDRKPETHLVMLGGDSPMDGASMSHYLQERAGSYAGQLHILGHLPLERLVPALSRADVAALPSLWESFGNAALEAMAVSRPVVVTTGNGFSEFCRDEENALMVAPGDPVALGDAILRLLEDKDLRKRLGESAGTEAQQYTADPGAKLHRDFFETVLARR